MTLEQYIEDLQAKGRYHLLRREAMQALKCSKEAFKLAALRLKAKNRLNNIRGDFWVIVPHEYRSWGIIPANWFIDNLVNYLEISYYVGLLSAAALYGAAHQQPQQFQVMVSKAVRPIIRERVSIKLFQNSLLSKIPIRKIQTETGYMNVSTPEITAADLVKFYDKAGHLSNVATVLAELKEKLNINEFTNIVNSNLYEYPILQRLGYLLSLDEVDGQKFAEPIEKIISQHKPRFVPLANKQNYTKAQKNYIWNLYINEEVELDL